MSLRKKLIRLAYQNPSLRDDILPLVKSADRVPAVNKETGKTVSVEQSTLKDPKKKKLYAPLKKEKGKGENRGGPFNRTTKERAENILRNIAKKEDWGSDKLDSEIKKYKGWSDKDLESRWLPYVEDYETEKDPRGPKHKDKQDKKEKDEKAKDFDEQKSSERVFNKKKVDELVKGLDKYLSGNVSFKDRDMMVSNSTISDIKQDLEKALKDKKTQIESLEKVKKQYGKWLGDDLDKIIEQSKDNAKRREKKSSLRSSLIRLAYEQPQLRADILPLITKSAGKHYDRWEMWSKLLKRSGLIVEIERNPMPIYNTELKVFYSRHKQFHNVDTLMGDIYATIGYDRNGTEFTVHTGNKSSGYTVGDERYALKDLVRYFK